MRSSSRMYVAVLTITCRQRMYAVPVARDAPQKCNRGAWRRTPCCASHLTCCRWTVCSRLAQQGAAGRLAQGRQAALYGQLLNCFDHLLADGRALTPAAISALSACMAHPCLPYQEHNPSVKPKCQPDTAWPPPTPSTHLKTCMQRSSTPSTEEMRNMIRLAGLLVVVLGLRPLYRGALISTRPAQGGAQAKNSSRAPRQKQQRSMPSVCLCRGSNAAHPPGPQTQSHTPGGKVHTDINQTARQTARQGTKACTSSQQAAHPSLW